MLEKTINTFSELIGISPFIIPNIITIIVVTFLLIYTLKGGNFTLTSSVILIAVYGASMAILDKLLGIKSVFNVFSLFF